MMNFDIIKVENIKKKIPTMSRLEIVRMLSLLERLGELYEYAKPEIIIRKYADYFKK